MLVWWRAIDWRACLVHSLTGIPAAALGVFFLAMIPVGRWLNAHEVRLKLWHLAIAGAVIGFLTGVVVSTGPLSVPAFTSYGLVKGGFIATEAASSLAVYVSKVVTFR